MALEEIVALLIQERDRINRALEALQVAVKRRGRPPKSPLADGGSVGSGQSAKRMGRPPMSEAEKRAASERMKKYWAAKRKAKK